MITTLHLLRTMMKHTTRILFRGRLTVPTKAAAVGVAIARQLLIVIGVSIPACFVWNVSFPLVTMVWSHCPLVVVVMMDLVLPCAVRDFLKHAYIVSVEHFLDVNDAVIKIGVYTS